MKKPEIFHTTRCTGQTYTHEQWSEHCRKHRQGGFIAFTYKDFQFNEFDVCITPHTLTDYNRNGCQLRITTAESPNGRWSYGICYAYGTGGGGFAPSFVSDQINGFASEKEAVYDALLTAERWLRRDSTSRPKDPTTNEFMGKIREYKDLFNPRQLELFC